MAEEIRQGDWVRHPDGEGEVVGVDDDGYLVRPRGLTTGGVFVPKGHRVERTDPLEEE